MVRKFPRIRRSTNLEIINKYQIGAVYTQCGHWLLPRTGGIRLTDDLHQSTSTCAACDQSSLQSTTSANLRCWCQSLVMSLWIDSWSKKLHVNESGHSCVVAGVSLHLVSWPWIRWIRSTRHLQLRKLLNTYKKHKKSIGSPVSLVRSVCKLVSGRVHCHFDRARAMSPIYRPSPTWTKRTAKIRILTHFVSCPQQSKGSSMVVLRQPCVPHEANWRSRFSPVSTDCIPVNFETIEELFTSLNLWNPSKSTTWNKRKKRFLPSPRFLWT